MHFQSATDADVTAFFKPMLHYGAKNKTIVMLDDVLVPEVAR